MISLLILFITVILLFFSIKFPGIALAYFLFYEDISFILFKKIGNPGLRFSYYAFLFLLFILVNVKREFRSSTVSYRLKNPISIGVGIMIFVILFQYIFAGTFIRVDTTIVVKFLTTYAPLVVIAALFVSKEQTIYELGYGIILFGILYFFILIFVADLGSIPVFYRAGIRALSNVNPISKGRTFGMLFIVSFVYFDCAQIKKVPKASLLITVLLSTYMMFFVSTRQVIISVVLILIIYGFVRGSDVKGAVRYGFLLLGIFVTGILLLNFFEFTILDRFRLLENYKQMYRYERLQLGVKVIPDVPFWGFGAGYFADMSGLGHAHNLFLGMALEYGLLGILSYLLVVGAGLVQSIKLMKRPNIDYREIVFILIWYLFIISTMFSGDSTGDRNLWTLSGVLITISYLENRSTFRVSGRVGPLGKVNNNR